MEKQKAKLSIKHVVSNNFWIMKFIFKYAPTLVWDKIIRIPISVLTTYINVNLTYWILNKIECSVDILPVIIMIVGIFSFYIITNCIMAIFSCVIIPQKSINLSQHIREDIICKVKNIDQINFQTPSFFDTYTMALNEIETRPTKVLNSFATIITSLLSFLLVTVATSTINSTFSLFGIGAVIIDISLGMVRQKLNYKRNVETTPDGRKRGYIYRLTYQPEFLPDLKIYSNYVNLLINRFRKATVDVKKILLKYAKKIIFLDQGSQISGLILRHMVPWIIVSILLFRKSITISEATVLTAAALTVPSTLTKFINGLNELYPNSLYIENLKKIFNYPENIEVDLKDKMELTELKSIKLNKLAFAYAHNSPNVLVDISVCIHQGEKIALVGYNGAGKSTLAKLLIRLFDPLQGNIEINNIPIDSYNIRSIRSKIAYLSQDFKIYGFTVAENVLMRPIESDDDRKIVLSILEKVGLSEKVKSLKNSIDTYITREFDSEGEYFSGGELQKLSLARLYAGNYDCIIMDESTSALDPISEDEIINTIFTIFKDKTIVMISHRLATIKYVDKVVFMSNGEIKGQGTHSQLLEHNKDYANFYLTQANKYDR